MYIHAHTYLYIYIYTHCIHIILRGSSQIRSRLGATREHFWVTCGNPWGSHGVIGVPVAFVLLLVGACPCFWALAGRPFLTWALQPGVPGCQRASKLVPLPVFTFVSHLEVFSDSKRGKWGAPVILGRLTHFLMVFVCFS